LCAELKGHTDNIVAAFVGGLTICGYKSKRIIYKSFFVRYGIKTTIAIPQNLEVKTKDAVAVLPKKVPFEDVVFNISQVAFFVSGIIGDVLETMGLGMEDRLHQPYRKALIPGLENIFETAKKSGTHGVSLSGAGSSVVAIINQNPEPIGKAMKKAFRRNRIEAKIMIFTCG
jgi:homoserine kinase